ncbi:hypothetical protein M231_06597 [Tremella mesenterica]|uniref:Uncharacterized protein n=1 Tax=Tremella mesenterica TaxID=5217 RepID=A0A4Q1BDL6_TREME|nr:hypothetical protein M231_06597 [Tremella mesenterica]
MASFDQPVINSDGTGGSILLSGPQGGSSIRVPDVRVSANATEVSVPQQTLMVATQAKLTYMVDYQNMKDYAMAGEGGSGITWKYSSPGTLEVLRVAYKCRQVCLGPSNDQAYLITPTVSFLDTAQVIHEVMEQLAELPDGSVEQDKHEGFIQGCLQQMTRV